ncbi:related to transporter (major facilitator superfamily) [Fusarium mangiferae]|uniref:Related to transporter (Major facilitator superfamily) n=1 Tax=Fusarium mangiferae TaxID=192010 RepID=A0A1L7U8T4_FUSMA|nr:uncharacterized protein FMAN_15290 [Fusarium mangiferae]CVL07148.1 related to transporter (major facilitator superfamily) [Fusarium mangiferae]
MGSGLATPSGQLIAVRSITGVAASLCLPSAVGIVSRSFPAASRPRSRSAAFSAMGGGQAVGFGLGLVMGGVFSDTVGWRWGFHATAILNCAVPGLALWALPPSIDDGPFSIAVIGRLPKEIDWVGAAIISASLALLSYELAVFSGTQAERQIRQPLNIALLCLALVLLPTFALWMRFQTQRSQPALIPNSLWTNRSFTAVCATVFLVWGSLNASEQLTTLYLQDVRGVSALTSSLYFLPAPICGALMNVAVGFFLPRMNPALAVAAGCLVSGIAPLLLATLCRMDGPSYWKAVFQAMALNPLGADLAYVIANLVVTAAFPARMQALAGGVFNMTSQIGKSVGIATTAVIAQQVTAQTQGLGTAEAVLQGYKAGWWYNCSMSFISVFLSYWELRAIGRLGEKRE